MTWYTQKKVKEAHVKATYKVLLELFETYLHPYTKENGGYNKNEF